MTGESILLSIFSTWLLKTVFLFIHFVYLSFSSSTLDTHHLHDHDTCSFTKLDLVDVSFVIISCLPCASNFRVDVSIINNHLQKRLIESLKKIHQWIWTQKTNVANSGCNDQNIYTHTHKKNIYIKKKKKLATKRKVKTETAPTVTSELKSHKHIMENTVKSWMLINVVLPFSSS